MFTNTASLITAALTFNLFAAAMAQAEVLPAKAADLICHKKALAAAHFIAENLSKPFLISFNVSPIAEISTVITYQYKYARSTETLYTVIAYAYPDDRTCLIGSITNNIAGND